MLHGQYNGDYLFQGNYLTLSNSFLFENYGSIIALDIKQMHILNEVKNYSVGSKCHFGPAVLLPDAKGLSGVVAL